MLFKLNTNIVPTYISKENLDVMSNLSSILESINKTKKLLEFTHDEAEIDPAVEHINRTHPFSQNLI